MLCKVVCFVRCLLCKVFALLRVFTVPRVFACQGCLVAKGVCCGNFTVLGEFPEGSAALSVAIA